MKVSFIVLDADYFLWKEKPVVRIFGKTEDGKTITVFYKDFFPYFYVETNNKERLEKFLCKNFSNQFLGLKEEYKFRPIGFSHSPVKMCKIILRDPSKVPNVREELLSKKIVKKAYEADILFKYRFLADFDIGGMQWVEAIGNNVNFTEIVSTDIKVEARDLKRIEKEHLLPQFKYLSFDIEVISERGIPNPEKDKIAIISLAFNPPYKGHKSLILVRKRVPQTNGIISCIDERDLLLRFKKIINEYDPDFIVGYNINNFDIPFLLTRMRVNKIRRDLGRCRDKNATSQKISKEKYRNRIPGRIVVDVYEIIKNDAKKGLIKLKRYGLGDVAEYFVGERKIDIAHSEIPKYWNGSVEMVLKLIEYARKDAELALKILMKAEMLDKFIAIARVTGLLLQDVIEGGESQRIENLLLREFNKRNYVLPLKPNQEEISKRTKEREKRELKGAIVLEPIVGLHTSPVVYLDFKSLYPSIMITYNICPTTFIIDESEIDERDIIVAPSGAKFISQKIREGIIPRIVRQLIKERDEVKKEMKREKDPIRKKHLYNSQYALKVVANAFYGYMGYIRARLYILDIANAITSYGRFWITKIKDIIEKKTPYKVIYGDTDSVMVRIDSKDLKEAFEVGKQLEKLVNRNTEGAVKIKIEGIFKSLLLLTKKRYAGYLFEDLEKGEIISKGIETVRRDWCDLVGETLNKVLEIILIEQNVKKAFEYVKKVVEKLQRNEIEIEKLIITKSISKPINEYKGIQPHVELVKKLQRRNPLNAPGVGDRIGFVIVKGIQKIAERAEDPEYVRKNNLPIDARYYIENQLLPPLERVFSAIGITRSQLVSGARQLLLNQIFPNSKTCKENGLENIDIKEFQGFICTKCLKVYSLLPLSGKCYVCKGDIAFYSSKGFSKMVVIE